MKHPRMWLRILTGGGILTSLTLAAGFLFLNGEECPAHYTPAQVDAAGCTVGANIGLGLVVLLSIAIGAGSLIGAAVAFLAEKKCSSQQ